MSHVHKPPTLTEVLACLLYFVAIFFGLWWVNRPVKALARQNT